MEIKEPNDGTPINFFKYSHYISSDLLNDMQSLGLVGYYYSVPAQQFAEWIDYVLTRHKSEKTIEGYKGTWINSPDIKDQPQYLYTAKIANNRQIAYLSCFKHITFRRGSVILIAASPIESVRWVDFVQQLVTTALKFWSENWRK